MDAARIKRGSLGEKGQTLVEFALIVLLLFAILFGIVEFGRLWYYSHNLSNAVRSAARYGAVLGSTKAGYSNGAVQDFCTSEIEHFMDKANIVGGFPTAHTTGTGNDGSPIKGDTITVTVQYNFIVIPGHIIPFFHGTHVLERTASSLYEGTTS